MGFETIHPAYFLISFLVILGVLYFFYKDEVEMDFDFERRFLKLKKKNRFRTQVRVIVFDAVETVFVQKIGREHKGVVFYFVMLRLVSGERESTGAIFSSRAEAQAHADLLAQKLGKPSQSMSFLPPQWDYPLPLALGLSVFAYVMYYRFTVGPLCGAMWFGSLPPVFIGGLTLSFYISLRAYSRR